MTTWIIAAASLALLGLTSTSALAETFHVAPNGNDDADGTVDAPWASFEHAAATAEAGDRVEFADGVYRLRRRVDFANSGTADAWITYAGAEGANVVFDASLLWPGEGNMESGGGAIHLDGASYVRLVGFTLRNSYGFGVGIFGPSSHVDVVDLDVDSTFAPGIGAWNCSAVRVVGNRVTNANTQSLRVAGDFDRECPHEAISIAGVDGFEVAWNEVYENDKEGIDVKEVSRRGLVHHNYVHDNPRQGLYADAWFGLLEDVAFVSNVSVRNEWGAVISVEGRPSANGQPSEVRDVRIEHNVLAENRASGVYFGVWGRDLMRRNVTIAQNTVVDNGDPLHWAGPTGSIDLRSENFENVRVTNNLLVGGGAFDLATSFEPGEAERAIEDRGTIIANNLLSSERNDTGHEGLYARPHFYRGEGQTLAEDDGSLVDRRTWTIEAASPAATAGEDGGYVGAIPPGKAKLPDAGPSPLEDEGFPAYRPHRFDDWPGCLIP